MPAEPAEPAEPADHASRVAATFCATLVDEWVRGGVGGAVICPGSRSTPVALALVSHPGMPTEVVLDERSGAFLALGAATATGRPWVVLCTSGTAAAEVHPAVIEAHQGRIPLVVVTADRPAELRHVGAPQSIDQTHLFGRAVRWFDDPGVPERAAEGSWRCWAARSVAESLTPLPGPVHLNLPFREPLVAEPGPLPPGREADRPWHRARRGSGVDPDQGEVARQLVGRTGMVIAGAGVDDPEAVHRLAGRLGWPVVGDPRSGCRIPAATTVSHADALLRVPELASELRPEVVLRLGDLPASKVVAAWAGHGDAHQIAVHPHGIWVDPDRTLHDLVAAPVGAWCDAVRVACGSLPPVAPPGGGTWRSRWQALDEVASGALRRVLADRDEVTEPAVARSVWAAVPDGGRLVVSSSMPVRDLEWYGEPRVGAVVHANRGANGIDGVVSTAVGVALSGDPTVALLGDLAFLHDSNGLLGLRSRGVDLVMVVVDNGGGGIFSFLPQAQQVDSACFERVWATPQPVDLVALAAAHGLDVACVAAVAELATAIPQRLAEGGAHLLVVTTDRAGNVGVHDELHRAVAEAVRASGILTPKAR